MRFFALGAISFLMASVAHADLNYLVYDISTKVATPITETIDVTAEEYRTGTKILFVQDTTISEDYYIGVFELTNAQAATLGWASGILSGEGEGVAYARSGKNTVLPSVNDFDLALSYPTATQWLAYAGKPEELSQGVNEYNIKNGCYTSTGRLSPSVSPADWQASSGWPFSASHGTYDMFGNVAEYTAEEDYYGGAALYVTNATSMDYSGLTNYKVSDDFEATHYLGARLVYTPQEAEAYDVYVNVEWGDVTANGIWQDDGNYKCDRRYNVVLETTHALPTVVESWTYSTTYSVDGQEKTVTGTLMPDTNGVFSFSVPASIPSGALIAFTPQTWVYPQLVIDDQTTVTILDESGEAYGTDGYYTPGTKVSLTAKEVPHEVFFKWSNGSTVNPYTFTLEKNCRYTLTPQYNTEPKVTVVNGSVKVLEGASTGDGYYTKGTRLELTAMDRLSSYQAFYQWSYGVAGYTENPLSIGPLNYNEELTYTAKYKYYPIVVANDATVNVTSGKALGENHYTANAKLTLTAKDKTGDQLIFKAWSGSSTSTSKTIEVTAGDLREDAPAQATYTATYEKAPRVLATDATIEIISGEDYGDGYYSVGTQLLIKSIDKTASKKKFVGWSGASSSTTETLTVTLTRSDIATVKQYTATYKSFPKVIVTDATISFLEGQDFGGGYYATGSQLLITANEKSKYSFVRWSGSNTSTTNPLMVTVGGLDSTATYTANYNTAPRVQVTDATVVVTSGKHYGDGYYSVGSVLQITPVDKTSQMKTFSAWSGASTSTSTTLTITLTAADIATTKSYVANYGSLPRVQVTDATVEVTSGKHYGDGYYSVGTKLTLTAKPKDLHVFKAWSTSQTTSTITVTVPAVGQTASYSVVYDTVPRVLVNGATVSCISGSDLGNGYYSVGATLKLTPTPLAREVFSAWSVSKGSQPTAQSEGAYTVTVPAVNTTASYTATFIAAPRVFVVNGSATVLSGKGYGEGYYQPNSQLKLTATTQKHKTFSCWKAGTSIVSYNDGYSLTVPSAGETMTYTAEYKTYPRVIVNGATVSCLSGTSYGDGYYSVGAQLKLTPIVPEGCRFTKWSDGTTASTLTVTVGAYGTTQTYSASVEIVSAAAQKNHVLTTPGTLPSGWYVSQTGTLTFEENTYTYPIFKQAESVVVDLSSKTMSYDPATLTLNSATKMSFKLVKPTTIDATLNLGETPFFSMNGTMTDLETLRKEVSPYYLAVTELATAHVSGGTDFTPYNVTSASSALTTLSNLYSDFELPTLAQLQAAVMVGYTATHQSNGDALQTATYSYASSSGNGVPVRDPAWVYATEVGISKGGFYGIIGHAAEWLSDSSDVYAGGYASTPGIYTLQKASEMKGLGCRPVLATSSITTVPVKISINGGSATIDVLKGATINLGSPAFANKSFLGWRVGTSTTTQTATSFVVNASTTYTAVYKDMTLATITYKDCSGTRFVPVGVSTLVTPTVDETKAFKSWTVSGGTMSGNQFTPTATTASVTANFTSTLSTISYASCTGPATLKIGSSAEIFYHPPKDSTLVFSCWKVSGGTMSGNIFTPTSTTATVTAEYASNAITVAYTDCTGPLTTRPGQSFQVYYEGLDETKLFDRWQVTGPATIAAEGWLTVNANATEKITVKAIYKAKSQGYQLRLR